MENQQYKWRQRKKRNNFIALWIVLVILLSVGVTFVYEGRKESSPLNVAKKYIEQEVGDADYKVEAGDRSLNNHNQFVQEYTVTYTADGQEKTQKLNMVQQNEKKYGLFEQWDLAGSAQGETRDVELIAPVHSQVLIDGVAPDASEIKEDETLSPGKVRYQLTGVSAEEAKIQVNGLPFDSYEGVLDTSSSVINICDILTVGENAQTQMTEIGKSMINELFTAAMENKNADNLGSLFDHAANKANLYKAIRDNLYDGDNLRVESLTFEGFKATFGEVYYPGTEEEAFIGMDMTLTYECKAELASQEDSTEESQEEGLEEEESESESETETEKSAAKEAKFSFKYQNGECVVTSIEVPGAIS